MDANDSLGIVGSDSASEVKCATVSPEFDLFGRSVRGELARRAREAASRKRARLARCATSEYADTRESVGKTLEIIGKTLAPRINKSGVGVEVCGSCGSVGIHGRWNREREEAGARRGHLGKRPRLAGSRCAAGGLLCDTIVEAYRHSWNYWMCHGARRAVG